MDIVQEIRELAYEQAKGLSCQIKSNPIDTLKTIQFEVSIVQEVNQEKIANLNVNLEPGSCLGNLVQAAVVAEKYFPGAKIEMAEVWEDFLRNFMLEMLKKNPSTRYDSSFMRELLMYEEPHAVVLINGVQFDPLSVQLGQDIEHPRIQLFPLWAGIANSFLVSNAWLEPDPEKKLRILERAEKICPETTLVAENIAEPLELLGKIDETIKKVKWALKRRLCARTLYVLYSLTEDKVYYNQLINTYTEEIVKYF